MSNGTYEQLSLADANNGDINPVDLSSDMPVASTTETSHEDIELNWQKRAQKVQQEAALINPRLFGSKVILSSETQIDLDEELNRLIENPAHTPQDINAVYVKYTGFNADLYYKLAKLGKKPKYEIESKSATEIGEWTLHLFQEVAQTPYAGENIKDNFKSVIGVLTKDIEEATFPAEFGRTLVAIEGLDTVSNEEAQGLNKLLEQLHEQIDAIPSRFS
ncbi:MAG: hypothetical protein WCP03_00395 [Candidatus Saccharibacteria bacterium]